MESLQERIKNSNQEQLVNDDKMLVSLAEHLVINKVLMPPEAAIGRSIAFFKIQEGELQVHARVPAGDTNKWFRFNIIDANDQEKEKNIKFNIGGE